MSEQRGWSRRQFLKGAGAMIALPFFPSLHPGRMWADPPKPPKRLMFMCVPLGFVPNKGIWNLQPELSKLFQEEGWFPETDGSDYKLPAVHGALAPYREHFSFLKGLSHQRYRGDPHYSDDVFLTGADTLIDPSRTFSNTISCDQVAAASPAMGSNDVRYPSLELGINPCLGTHSGCMAWTQQGVPLSPLRSPAQAFDRLFGKDDLPPATRLARLKQKRSVLDVMSAQIGDLNRTLNAADRRKLDEALTAVRGVEADIQREEKWIDVPKPTVALARTDATADQSASIRHTQAMFDLAHAAFLTDSTRVITYEMPDVFMEYSNIGKHGLNHSDAPEAQAAALRFDQEVSNQLARFMGLLCATKEHDGQPLMHHTLAAVGSGCWGMNHHLHSLPAMLIGHGGGAIKQGETRTYDSTTPLANLWLTMLKTCGVAVESFADSTGTLKGLT